MSILFEIQTIKRIKNSEKIKIVSPKDVYNIKQIQDIKDATQENLIVITLNRKNRFNFTAFGREVNKYLKNIEVPDEMPSWVYNLSFERLHTNNFEIVKLDNSKWKKYLVKNYLILKEEVLVI